MEEKICPMPSKHFKLWKGKAYFQAQENSPTTQNNPEIASEPHDFNQDSTSLGHHEHRSHHGRKGRGHHPMENQFPQDSLAHLLMQCGHHLFHLARQGEEVSADEIGKGLTPSEQAQLKDLLNPLITSWNHQ